MPSDAERIYQADSITLFLALLSLCPEEQDKYIYKEEEYLSNPRLKLPQCDKMILATRDLRLINEALRKEQVQQNMRKPSMLRGAVSMVPGLAYYVR